MRKILNGKEMKLTKSLLLPYLKRFWLMLLSVVLVGSFGCGILIGMRNAYHSLNENVTSLIEECGYPDLYAQMIEDTSASYLSFLDQEYYDFMGIEKAEYRVTYTTTFTLGENTYSGRLIGYSEDSLLKHHLVSGELKEGNVRIEYYFSQTNNINIGDVITAKMPNGKTLEYKIDATIVSPETSNVKADPYSVSSTRDFAYIYVPKETLDKNSKTKHFNEILYDYKDGEEKSIEETIDSLKEYVKQKNISITDEQIKQLRNKIAYATTYEESEVITYYGDVLRGINLITLLAPAVFFLVVLIVTALFLFQIVKQCRKDIGIMRALGESKKSISLVFLSLGSIIGVLSWLIGLGVGTIFTILANGAYGGALKLFPQALTLYPAPILISLGLIVFVTIVTAFFASLSISKIKPVEAMKALPPSNNETPLLTRTLFKKTPIALKVTISQTLRNLKRYILSGVCLLASGMLIFFAFSIMESKNTMMDQLFNARLNYDIQVYFDDMPSDNEIETSFPSDDTNITARTLIKYLPSEMTNTKNDKKTTALINGIKADQDLVRIVSDYNNFIPISEHGIILSSYHAYLLDAEIGDIIKANDVELEVTAISNEYMYQVSYTNFDEYNPEYARGSLLVKVNNQDEFFEKYKDTKHVTYISRTDTLHHEFNDKLSAFEISGGLLTAMAIVVGFMIVFNMMQTNLKEQKRSFATMRTLGYQRSQISNANLVTSLFQFLVAMCFAIPIGVLMSKYLLQAVSIPSQIFPFPLTWIMYVFSILLVLAFLLISHYIVMGMMKKWNLPESVKERE